MPATPDDAEVRALVQAAERAGAAGQPAELERLLTQAQARAPEHPLVLNLVAVAELNRGDATAARAHLERALEREARNPALWINLATALRRLKLAGEEMAALDRALAIEPRHLLALLQKGSLLELQGKTKAAARLYQNALQTLPRSAKLPENLARPLRHALEVVRVNDAALEAFVAGRVREVAAHDPDARRDRFEHCIDTFLGKLPVYTQHPTFLHFPQLPAIEFFARREFPWLSTIEAATPAIRSEFERVCAGDAQRLQPYISYPEGVPLDQWAELNHSRKWSVFYLWRDGSAVTENQERCPRTVAALADIPLMKVPGYGPTVFFSILEAKSKIPPHTGVTNTRSIVHLPLVVPPGCGFRVGCERREWRAGTAWVFDDTYEHEAWNDSEVPRGILIFDVWNPYLTPAERELVAAGVTAIRDFYGAEVSFGATG